MSLWECCILFAKSYGFFSLWVILFILLAFVQKEEHQKKYQSSAKIATGLSFILPVLLLWILYRNVIGNWWLIDDPCHLFYISQNGILPAFFDHQRGFSPINFTPWEPLSLGIDYLFFGLNPAPFYWHHMISLSLLLLLSQVFLLRFLLPFFAAFSLSLFVSCVPFCDAANHLMTRHYIEGLIFALVSVYLFIRAQEKNNLTLVWASAFLYLLACLAKEVYVPLFIILAVLSAGETRERLKSLYPFLAIFVLYMLWRYYMLGSSGMLSAYPHIPITAKDIIYLPLSIIKTMGWDSYSQLFTAGLLFIIFIIFVFKNTRQGNLLIILFVFCALLPILPVASTLYSRYLFLPSFIYFIGMGIGLQYLQVTAFLKGAKFSFIVVIGVVAVLISVVNIQNNVKAWQDYGKEIQAEGEFLLYNEDPQNLLITTHGHCYWAFSALRKTVLALPQGPSFCVMDCSCAFLHPGKKVWINLHGQLYKAVGKMEGKAPEECGEKRELFVDISYSQGKLKWLFGPYRRGKYFMFINGWDSGLIQVVRAGEMLWEFDLLNDFVIVKYESYDGWNTYSPILKLKETNHNEGGINWKR